MKLIICHNFYQQRGGEDQSYAAEADLLEAHGHEVVRYTLHNDAVKDMSGASIAKRTIWSQESQAQVRDLIREHQPDLMHCHNTFPMMSPSIYYAAHNEGVPVVQALRNYRLLCINGLLMRDGKPCEDCVGKSPLRGILHGCYRGDRAASAAVGAMLTTHRAMGTWHRMIDRYISLSHFAREKFIKAGFDGNTISVKPNFIAQDPGPGDGHGGFALFVGRLSEEKGIDTLLEAWRVLERPLRLKIIGDGPMAPVVRSAADSDNRIQWLGQQPHPQVIDLLGQARCAIVPSTCYETFGRTVIEAFARATPVIATAHGAPAELIDHGQTGYLFALNDAHDLAAQVRLVIDRNEKAQAMRINARQAYEEKYTAEAHYAALMNVYDEVVGHSSQTLDDKAAA